MSEDLTKAVTVKRNAKKKSGYIVSEQEGYYYVKEAPAKARVNPGDKVVGINGIKADEFLDEEDANNLIESIRIVVIPQDKIEEYDNAKGSADEEEQYEEYDRRNQPKTAPQPRNGTNGTANSVPEKEGPTVSLFFMLHMSSVLVQIRLTSTLWVLASLHNT
jgi:predicted metalloprotease with PDZ domain